MSEAPEREIEEPRSARVGLIGLWALTFGVVTCTAGSHVESAVGAEARAPTSSPAAPAPSVAPSSVPSVPTLAEQLEEAPQAGGPLASFVEALRGLQRKERKESVRILWLGDSHTAADFWSHEVRARLSQELGDGGPGLVHVGLKLYRHGAAEVLRDGEWRTRPKRPGFFEPQEDGVFGIGGMHAVPREARSLASIELGPKRVACEPASPGCWRNGATKPDGIYQWEIVYRLPTPVSAFTASIGNQSKRVNRELAEAEPHAEAGLFSVRFSAPGTQTLKLTGAAGEPELFGVYVDAETPGLVVDTLGINGARISTAASWNRAHWVEEVKRRAPSLLILAYGTNEAGDSHSVASYEAKYTEVIGRYREAVPSGPCLLLGPTERVRPDWTTNPRVIALDELLVRVADHHGCAFLSVFEAMGGEGSLREWAHSEPPLASRDRVHLTPAGYRRLGRVVADFLRAGLEAPTPKASDAVNAEP